MTVECLTCGGHVSEPWARVFGDQEGNVVRCPECDSAVRIQRGSAAGVDVAHVDPRDDPSRFGGYS